MKLKELRKEKKKTQEEIASVLNLSTAAYGRYEVGNREPTLETLIKLADYYGVSLDYLVGRKFNDEIGYLDKADKETIQLFLSLNEPKNFTLPLIVLVTL